MYNKFLEMKMKPVRQPNFKKWFKDFSSTSQMSKSKWPNEKVPSTIVIMEMQIHTLKG